MDFGLKCNILIYLIKEQNMNTVIFNKGLVVWINGFYGVWLTGVNGGLPMA